MLLQNVAILKKLTFNTANATYKKNFINATWLGIFVKCNDIHVFSCFYCKKTLIIHCMLQKSLLQIHNVKSLHSLAVCGTPYEVHELYSLLPTAGLLSDTGETCRSLALSYRLHWVKIELFLWEQKSRTYWFLKPQSIETYGRLKCSFNSDWDASQTARQNVMQPCL